MFTAALYFLFLAFLLGANTLAVVVEAACSTATIRWESDGDSGANLRRGGSSRTTRILSSLSLSNFRKRGPADHGEINMTSTSGSDSAQRRKQLGAPAFLHKHKVRRSASPSAPSRNEALTQRQQHQAESTVVPPHFPHRIRITSHAGRILKRAGLEVRSKLGSVWVGSAAETQRIRRLFSVRPQVGHWVRVNLRRVRGFGAQHAEQYLGSASVHRGSGSAYGIVVAVLATGGNGEGADGQEAMTVDFTDVLPARGRRTDSLLQLHPWSSSSSRKGTTTSTKAGHNFYEVQFFPSMVTLTVPASAVRRSLHIRPRLRRLMRKMNTTWLQVKQFNRIAPPLQF